MKIKYHLNLVFLIPVLLSCVNTKRATYFNNLSDTEIQYQVESLDPVIQKNDLLSISVSSVNPEAAQVFNLHSASSTQGNVVSGSIFQSTGYLVDQEGNIQFPLLGSIKAAGITKNQLKENITKAITQKNLLYEPLVNIRYLNYKVTVLGEVAHPSVINVPNEKITLLEALGLAGDLTLYGRRDNVMIIRETEGKRTVTHVNLNDRALLQSPYYFLKSNDVVYVAPNKARVASTSRTTQWLPILFSSLSFATILIDRITR